MYHYIPNRMKIKTIKMALVIIAIAFALPSLAQTPFPTDDQTKRVTYTETVTVGDTLNKTVLYTRAKDWMNKFYPGVKITLEDETSGKLMLNGDFIIKLTYDFKYKSDNIVAYYITILVKDGKYKYSITEFTTTKSGTKTTTAIETAYPKMTTQNKTEFSSQLNAEITRISEDLKIFMRVGETKDANDW